MKLYQFVAEIKMKPKWCNHIARWPICGMSVVGQLLWKWDNDVRSWKKKEESEAVSQQKHASTWEEKSGDWNCGKKNQVKLFVFFKTVSKFDQAAQRPFNGQLNVILRVYLNNNNAVNKNKTGLSGIVMPNQMFLWPYFTMTAQPARQWPTGVWDWAC